MEQVSARWRRAGEALLTSRPALAVLLTGTLAAATRNLVAWSDAIRPGSRQHVDFFNFIDFALLVRAHGWNHLYDLDYEHAAANLVPTTFYYDMYPPFLTALYYPLSFLRLDVGYTLLLIVNFASYLAAAWLLAPRDRTWLGHVLLGLGISVFWFGVVLGQLVPVAMLAVAAATVLLRQERGLAAGICLSAILFKPQLAYMVPACLLAAGHLRAVAGFAVASALALVWAVMVVTPTEFAVYARRVAGASTNLHSEFSANTITGLLGSGGVGIGLFAALVVASLLLARRMRANVNAVVAIGLVASFLVSPYHHNQDLIMLLPAYWLWLSGFRPAPLLAFAVGLVGWRLIEREDLGGLVVAALAWLALLLAVTRPHLWPNLRPRPADAATG